MDGWSMRISGIRYPEKGRTGAQRVIFIGGVLRNQERKALLPIFAIFLFPSKSLYFLANFQRREVTFENVGKRVTLLLIMLACYRAPGEEGKNTANNSRIYKCVYTVKYIKSTIDRGKHGEQVHRYMK